MKSQPFPDKVKFSRILVAKLQLQNIASPQLISNCQRFKKHQILPHTIASGIFHGSWRPLSMFNLCQIFLGFSPPPFLFSLNEDIVIFSVDYSILYFLYKLRQSLLRRCLLCVPIRIWESDPMPVQSEVSPITQWHLLPENVHRITDWLPFYGILNGLSRPQVTSMLILGKMQLFRGCIQWFCFQMVCYSHKTTFCSWIVFLWETQACFYKLSPSI